MTFAAKIKIKVLFFKQTWSQLSADFDSDLPPLCIVLEVDYRFF